MERGAHKHLGWGWGVIMYYIDYITLHYFIFLVHSRTNLEVKLDKHDKNGTSFIYAIEPTTNSKV